MNIRRILFIHTYRRLLTPGTFSRISNNLLSRAIPAQGFSWQDLPETVRRTLCTIGPSSASQIAWTCERTRSSFARSSRGGATAPPRVILHLTHFTAPIQVNLSRSRSGP